MDFQDKSIQCSDCGVAFIFSSEDQEFFQAKGFTNEPKRCMPCRKARKAERSGSDGYTTRRQMFPATCNECGKESEVPFQPRSDKPVYCSDCYRKVRPIK